MSFTLILQTRYHTRCTTNLKTQILSFLILLILCRLWMSASQQQLPDKKEKRCPHRTLVVSKLAPCQIWYQGAPNLGRAETFAWMSCVYNIYYIYIICICSYIVYAYVMYDIYVHICIHKYIYIYICIDDCIMMSMHQKPKKKMILEMCVCLCVSSVCRIVLAIPLSHHKRFSSRFRNRGDCWPSTGKRASHVWSLSPCNFRCCNH